MNISAIVHKLALLYSIAWLTNWQFPNELINNSGLNGLLKSQCAARFEALKIAIVSNVKNSNNTKWKYQFARVFISICIDLIWFVDFSLLAKINWINGNTQKGRTAWPKEWKRSRAFLHLDRMRMAPKDLRSTSILTERHLNILLASTRQISSFFALHQCSFARRVWAGNMFCGVKCFAHPQK